MAVAHLETEQSSPFRCTHIHIFTQCFDFIFQIIQTLRMGQGGAKTICQEEENFYKVCHLVLDEIPAHLRQYFKQLWDITYPTTPWDDTASSGQLLLNAESNRNTKTLIRTRMQDGDRSKWDGTALFAVLLYSSQTFTSINPNAVSCIDQLRIIRNSHFAHLDSAKVSNSAYQKIFSDAKQMFTQMNWSLNGISAIENSRTSATDGVNLLRQLQEERARHDNLEKWIQTVEDDVAQLSLNNQELVKHLKDTGEA